MPLIQGSSREAVSDNIRREMAAGKPQRQSVAIALDVARRSKRAAGGPTAAPWFVRSEARGMMHTGPIISPIAGRTDRHKMSVPAGSYVIPADHISGLGQGNTLAGMRVLDSMFRTGPYGVSMPSRMGRGSTMPRGIKAPSMKLAAGGGVGEPVPVLTAGGEYVVSPDVLIQKFGDIDLAHKIMDKWVLDTRKDHIKTLRGLPGPAK